MTLRKSVLVFFVCWIALMRAVTGFTSGNETALRTALFTTSQYDVSVRPNGTTIVSLTLTPTSVNTIDIKAQTMSMSGWWVLSWEDDRLTWIPSNYDDISETHVFEDDVWTPTIVVYNSVNDLSAIDEDTIPVRILSSGQLEWSPPGILTVSCNTDITHFPFDTQTCGVSVKTFGYTNAQLDLEADSDEIDMTYYSPSGEWDFIRAWTHKAQVYNYTQVTFNFKFQRKPAFYGLNLILPVLMMALMSIFIFLLPADSGEKMGYSLTVMLTFVVLMTLLASSMPTTADQSSYFEVYIVLILALCALSVILSIVSLNLYFRDEAQPVPAKLQNIILLLMRVMCRRKLNKTENRDRFFATTSHIRIQSATLKTSTGRSEQEEEPSSVKKDGEASEELEVTWKKASIVMDAFCFRLYIVLFVLLTVIFLSLTGAN